MEKRGRTNELSGIESLASAIKNCPNSITKLCLRGVYDSWVIDYWERYCPMFNYGKRKDAPNFPFEKGDLSSIAEEWRKV